MLSEAKQQQVAQYRSSVGEGGGGGGGGGYAASDMPQTSDATNRSSFATVYGAAPYSSDYSRDAYAQLADSSNYSRDAYAQVPNYSNPFA
jgi:hypothetical protein